MQKKNVLGTDPLSWLKDKDKEEKPEKSESSVNSQEKLSEKVQEPEKVDARNITSKGNKTKPIVISNIEKAVERSKDESVRVSEINKQQHQEKTFESSDAAEVYRKKVLGESAYTYHTKTREVTQKDSPATMFVIVYTVLLLILGFIIYRDLTKQIDTLNAKLTSLEKKVDEGTINYEDTKVNDVW